MAKFKIYGDYGYVSEKLLEEFDTLSAAEDWIERWFGDGDFGGYAVIEIATFAEDGEYLIERRWDAEDYCDETVCLEDDAEWWEY